MILSPGGMLVSGPKKEIGMESDPFMLVLNHLEKEK